ncbi:hypothetical protein Tco_0750426 [Tanacetum coccineum]|uniref:Uncharacterized protein n=1 Tax=Tanacetum coccineum TaxID=301880 RepID=A0ABQ4Z264_9ASTR
MYRPPSELSRQEEFENIMMNFILDQEERVGQLKDYMRAITEEFMAMSKRARSTKGQASSSREETMEEKVHKLGLFNSGNHQMNYNNLVGCSIHSRDAVDWEFLSNKGLAQPFFDFINTDTFSGPQWVNLFQINEPIFRELIREFFASFEFDASPCRYEPLHKGVTFRLGGVEREMPLLEFGWRVGLYSERESQNAMTLSGLGGAETVNSTHLTHMFWPIIGDGGYNVGNTKAKSIRNPRIKLAHRCITMTITGRKETTNRVTEIDLFYLYCIFWEGVVCNIPYWLAKYLKSVRDKSVIFKGMFITRIARSFGFLTNEMVVKDGEGDDEERDGERGNKGVGGSADIYRNMSQGDWQVRQARWMDQQDEHLGRIDTWMGQQDERAHWMYNHTVLQFQYLFTHDNLNPHLQIDPFLGYKVDYPPVGYQGYMPPGYAYRLDPSHDGSS